MKSFESISTPEDESLLQDRDEVDLSGPLKEGGKRKTRHLIIIAVSGAVILCLAVLVATVSSIKTCTHTPAQSDDLEAIHDLKIVRNDAPLEYLKTSEYFGEPGKQTDKKWDILMQNKYIRVSSEELRANGRSSVRLNDGNYLAWLGVYHELHCLNLVRRWVYKDDYFPDMSVDTSTKFKAHINHCLDRVREVLMCHADVSSLTTMDWNLSYSNKPIVNGTKTLHACINWNALVDSMQHRIVSDEEIANLDRDA